MKQNKKKEKKTTANQEGLDMTKKMRALQIDHCLNRLTRADWTDRQGKVEGGPGAPCMGVCARCAWRPTSQGAAARRHVGAWEILGERGGFHWTRTGGRWAFHRGRCQDPGRFRNWGGKAAGGGRQTAGCGWWMEDGGGWWWMVVGGGWRAVNGQLDAGQPVSNGGTAGIGSA